MTYIDRQTLRVLITASLFAVTVWLLYSLRELFFLLLLGLFLAYTIEPLVLYLRRLAPRSISRNSAIVVIYLLVLLVFGGALIWLASSVSLQAGVLMDSFPEVANSPAAATRIQLPTQLEPFRDDILKFAHSFAEKAMAVIMERMASAGWFFVVPIFALYFLKEGSHFGQAAIAFANRFGMAFGLHRLMGEVHEVLSKYIRAVLLLSLSVFVVYSIFYQAMGVPYAMLLATIAALFEVVPVIGWIAAACLSIGIASFGGYPYWGWMLAFYLVFRLVQDYAITPFLMSKGVALHPLAVLAGVIGGEVLAGVPGMFLSIPLMATARILYRRLDMQGVRLDTTDS